MRLQPLSNFFPLYTYPEDDLFDGAEVEEDATSRRRQQGQQQPELWADEHDPLSVYWMTQFQLHKLPHTVKRLHTPDSAPDGRLPALLCPNGDLLSASQLSAWFDKQLTSPPLAKQTADDERAWCTLFEQKLMPAWVGHASMIYKEAGLAKELMYGSLQ